MCAGMGFHMYRQIHKCLLSAEIHAVYADTVGKDWCLCGPGAEANWCGLAQMLAFPMSIRPEQGLCCEGNVYLNNQSFVAGPPHS